MLKDISGSSAHGLDDETTPVLCLARKKGGEGVERIDFRGTCNNVSNLQLKQQRLATKSLKVVHSFWGRFIAGDWPFGSGPDGPSCLEISSGVSECN